jgi:hypothetical protein
VVPHETRLWGESHGSITITSGMEEKLLPNSRRPNHRSWTLYLIYGKYNHRNLSEVNFNLNIKYILVLWPSIYYRASCTNILSIRPSVWMMELEKCWTDLHEIWHCFVSPTFAHMPQFWLKSDKFNGHFIYACYPSLTGKRKTFKMSPWGVQECARMHLSPSPFSTPQHNVVTFWGYIQQI